MRNYFSDIVRWFKYRFVKKHQYHVVHLGTKPGYSDIVERIIHANFQLLKQFVEEENPFELLDWNHSPEHQFAAKEIKELYDWYINVRPKRDELDPIHQVEMPPVEFIKVPGKNYSTMKRIGTPEQEETWNAACWESSNLEEQWNKEDSDNIKRLADIRMFLWT